MAKVVGWTEESDREGRHRKKAASKKPFAIEARYAGKIPERGFFSFYYRDKSEWHVYKRYATESARDDALDCLGKGASTWSAKFEYRKMQESRD